MTTNEQTTMQVRALRPAGGSSYYYFEGVTAERAVELARWYASAQCVPVAYFEVRDDAYPSHLEPPVLTAPAEATR